MDALEMRHNHRTNVTEAALQLKSNAGTLVIDDFGRQRMSPIELLNRWIVPLEKRKDYLSLANGSKVRVPFDQLIIFSTNLEPGDLVDEAFLRRIPHKINVVDPTEAGFRRLFDLVAPRLGIEIVPGAVGHLIARHDRGAGRPFRCCQPRDLLLQIRSRAGGQAGDVRPRMRELLRGHVSGASTRGGARRSTTRSCRRRPGRDGRSPSRCRTRSVRAICRHPCHPCRCAPIPGGRG